MTKKHFIALADHIKDWQDQESETDDAECFTKRQLDTIATFCASQNPRFNRGRWLDYIAGLCGPNGGVR